MLSGSPFRKLSQDEERQTLFQRVTGYTRHEVAEAEAVLGVARAFIEWHSMPYMGKYKEYLEKMANQPMPISDHLQMVAAAARNSVYREILTHLKTQEVHARHALGETE